MSGEEESIKYFCPLVLKMVCSTNRNGVFSRCFLPENLTSSGNYSAKQALMLGLVKIRKFVCLLMLALVLILKLFLGRAKTT